MSLNLNWENSTKNLVTFKRWDGVNDEKFQYCGSSLKNPIFWRAVGWGGGVHEKTIFLEGCESPKKVAWIVFRFKRGLSKKKKEKKKG